MKINPDGTLRISVHDEDSIFWKKELVSIVCNETFVKTPIARLEFQDCFNEEYDFINITMVESAYDEVSKSPYLLLHVDKEKDYEINT